MAEIFQTFFQILICLLVLFEGILSRTYLKNEDIIERNILWDDNLDVNWELSKQKRDAGLPGNINNLPAAGAGSQNTRIRNSSQNAGNSSQNGGNSSRNGGNSSQNGDTNHINKTVKQAQAQGGSSTANAWNYKTSDNKGSLTFTIPYEVSAMSESSIC